MAIPFSVWIGVYASADFNEAPVTTVSEISIGPYGPSWDSTEWDVEIQGQSLVITPVPNPWGGGWGGSGYAYGNFPDGIIDHETLTIALSETLPSGVELEIEINSDDFRASKFFEPGESQAILPVGWPVPPPFGAAEIGGETLLEHWLGGGGEVVESNGTVWVADQRGLCILSAQNEWVRVYTLPPVERYYNITLAATDAYVFLGAYGRDTLDPSFFIRASSPEDIQSLPYPGPSTNSVLQRGRHPSFIYKPPYAGVGFQYSTDGEAWFDITDTLDIDSSATRTVAHSNGLTFLAPNIVSVDGIVFTLLGEDQYSNPGSVFHSNLFEKTLCYGSGEWGFGCYVLDDGEWVFFRINGQPVEPLGEAFDVSIWGLESSDVYCTITTLNDDSPKYYPYDLIEEEYELYDLSSSDFTQLSQGLLVRKIYGFDGDYGKVRFYWLTDNRPGPGPGPEPEPAPAFWTSFRSTIEIR